MGFNPKDHYFKKAKKEGYLARSAYKLDEIQKRYRLVKPGNKVFDLGCAPGAWSQVALKVVGPQGFVEGIDLKEVTLKHPNARFFVKDVYELQVEDLTHPIYDVIISDMAPNTTGIAVRDQALSEELCRKVLDVCDQFLKPKGHMTMKLFMGPESKTIENEVKTRFKEVQLFRPKGTRKESSEIYLIGKSKI